MIKNILLEAIYDYQRETLFDENMSIEKIHYHIPSVKEFYDYIQSIDEDELINNPLKHLIPYFPDNEVYDYMIIIAKYFLDTNNLHQAQEIIKKILPIALISQIYGLAEDCYLVTKDLEFSLYLFKEAIKKAKEQNNSTRLYMIKETLESLGKRTGEKSFLELKETI